MSQRVLITGGSGFVGQWMCRAFLERGARIFAGTLDGVETTLLSKSERDAISWTNLDVLSDADIHQALASSAPEWVVHLAGIAFPQEANASPVRAYEVNVLGTARLLNALEPRARDHLRILVVGSAEQYGPHSHDEYPLRETAEQWPRSPYGASKAAQETIALQMFRGRKLPVICVRSFNHSGAGQREDYLLPALVRRARDLPPSGGKLRTGNNSPIRDYLHVADVADAYVGLLERGEPGAVYNVSSGEGRTVRELAERVLNRLGVSAEVSVDPSLVRPVDTPILVGDNTKLRRATGWAPKRSIDDIIDDLIHAAPR
jgi:GDP-4-dehydro-6-deoxy-D-mannose reductase